MAKSAMAGRAQESMAERLGRRERETESERSSEREGDGRSAMAGRVDESETKLVRSNSSVVGNKVMTVGGAMARGAAGG